MATLCLVESRFGHSLSLAVLGITSAEVKGVLAERLFPCPLLPPTQRVNRVSEHCDWRAGGME